MTGPVDRDGFPAISAPPPKIPLDRARLPTSMPIAHPQSLWNTSYLPSRVATDAIAAGCAAGMVSPLITMIDRAIILRASRHAPILPTLRSSLVELLTRPHIFLISRPFRLITTLYFGTYFTANVIDTVSSTLRNTSPEKVTSGPAKFAATTSVNMSLCLYKDSQFAKMFGAPTSPLASAANPIPKASYLLFAARDSLTVFASFNLPPYLSPLLPLSSSITERYFSSASAAQFLAPAGIQLLSTPLHLLGLDLYNRPRVGWRDRVGRVARDWGGTSLARMGRVIPAFGIGGVVNGKVRRKGMAMVGGEVG